VSQYQKGKTNPDFSEARDSEWQWHQLDHMQVCTLLQTDNHANTSLLRKRETYSSNNSVFNYRTLGHSILLTHETSCHNT